MFNCQISIPHANLCRPSLPFSLFHLVNYFHKNKVWPEFDTQELTYHGMVGSNICENREAAVIEALKTNKSHILFLDDDMGFMPHALHMLANRRLPLVACNYRKRNPPAEFIAQREGVIVETTDNITGLEPVDYIGMGFFLAETDVFRNIPQPWFGYEWKGGSCFYGEDIIFVRKAMKYGFTTLLDHDASKQIWHSGNVSYCYNDDFTKINTQLR